MHILNIFSMHTVSFIFYKKIIIHTIIRMIFIII